MRTLATLALLSACAQRPLDIPIDGGVDLASAVDLAQPDFGPPDLLPRPDLYVPTDECADGPRRLYVVDLDGTLSRFRPDLLSFTDVAKLGCGVVHGQTMVNSMGVRYDGSGWVGNADGEFFQVDTETGTCTPAFSLNALNIGRFGMTFGLKQPGSTEEELYLVWSQKPANLGAVDLATGKLTTIAYIPTAEVGPELTASPDAKLYAFFPQIHPRVSEIDRATGDEKVIATIPQLEHSYTLGYAFAYWSGDFWIFNQRKNTPSTTVYRVGMDGSVSVAIADTNRHIVGAGVSTCKPR